MRTPLFDAYVFVDWSARSQPTPARPVKDAIWVGALMPGIESPTTTYHRTRHAAFAHVRQLLIEAVARELRVLVGFDVSYGYPAGFARHLAGTDAGWQTVWQFLSERIEDGADNGNNRFDVADAINAMIGGAPHGPYWGHPRGRSYPALKPTSPGFPYPTGPGPALERLRLCERRLPGVQENWKLLGVGSVGSQVLLGIPYLHRLRHDPALRAHTRVWPFETNFANGLDRNSGVRIVHAETWPGIVNEAVADRLATDPEAIKDEVQVREVCAWARRADLAGELDGMLATPPGLTAREVAICLREEGWILGAAAPVSSTVQLG